MRILILALLVFTAGTAGCSYDDVSPTAAPIQLLVNGIPATAVRLDATLVDATLGSQSVHPQFGAGTASSLSLSLPPPSTTGPFVVNVQAFDAAGTQIASGTANGTYSGPTPPTSLQVTLR